MEEGQLEASNLPANIWHSEVTVSVTGEPPSAVEEEKETAEETEKEKEVLPEIVEPLSILDVLRISAVLEDTADQLSILNYIMPVQYERKQSVIMKKNKSLEKLAEAPRTSRLSSPFLPKEESKLPEIKKGSQFTDEFNKLQDLVFKKLTRQTIMSTEILKKIQIDRQFFSDIITKTMQELEESGTFTSLLEALGKERENKMHFYDIIAREEKGKKQIKSLQKHLFTVKKERQAEIQSRNEYIAHLKDQLQEMKAKTNMENRYMKRNTDLQISQTQKKCNRTEELLLEEIEKLRLKTEEENRIHMEIETFLKKEQQKLEEKLEFWMEKFDKDTEMKQNELNALKSAKASDLAHLQELAKTIREYEQVIIEDRTEKEKTRKKIEQEDLELKSIIKLQAWWRGTMVRREIGGFKMPKKDKDDVKDSKGKGKDKNKRTGKKK
ncbi:dynein regulatory complex protein 9 isoform X1 [Canis lupus baileyi]|uniref:Dynein regulatory complex protein 9 n=1 Tax=Canis lupus familiaris TaxID=9615 RepID=A0A8C0TPA5_CANLF|nr:dynein regulatory complex protein 9 isoform X1 [Canis lupus familiaris]XP_022269551.1 dynein regulatory complex protein 9 isoform X1 [Canis lupus familiaris]XP_025330332.1 dynein regulatory complex protein 9 isoform X1 [Canis lupus dingo]XP_025330341.1 dynein regulatory complex protein 9 isoform X1 [Canis lupus dingo]XP_025330351.1 dynein regulatory complex protein 9 isoform X1 [Canis lupus dingo]XP_038318413.1 dynein regulatory complex protein 9 isoform X1 [Canis lupus familiaris]XP_03843|eukprot:XP_005639646.1 IQ domain-containing protein G isoform X1 [Canis lupus familiaris]